jgi:hypothetical protein
LKKSGYLRLRAQIEKNEGEVGKTRNERDLLESRTNIHTRKQFHTIQHQKGKASHGGSIGAWQTSGLNPDQTMNSMAFKETNLSTDYMTYLYDSMAKVKHIYGDFE